MRATLERTERILALKSIVLSAATSKRVCEGAIESESERIFANNEQWPQLRDRKGS